VDTPFHSDNPLHRVDQHTPEGRLKPRIIDGFDRTMSYLRVSVTDRCNYSCHYCMPSGGWIPTDREKLLSLEEIARFVSVLSGYGVRKVRLTGGEPLLRKNLCQLVEWLSGISGLNEIALTTNGHLLGEFADELYECGLTRMTVSLDTFDPHLFNDLTGGELGRVLVGLDKAKQAGFQDIGINIVALKGINQGQLASIAAQCWDRGHTPRFIELMPIGGLAYQGEVNRLTRREITAELSVAYTLKAAQNPLQATSGPAMYQVVADGPYAGQRLGTISPMTDPHFCGACNRARLTARGGFRPCLANDEEVSVLQAMRTGASDEQLAEMVMNAMRGKLSAHRLNESNFVPLDAMTGIGG
jgi:cyclic pyranopterin phosphate synthase